MDSFRLRAPWYRRQPGPAAATALRAGAPIVAVAVVVGYLVLVVRADPPADGEYRHQILVARYVLMAVVVAGAALAVRWPIVGASVVALAAAVVGALHASDHSTASAFVVTLLFVIPAVALWAVWQRSAPVVRTLTVAVVMAVAFLGAGWGAQRVNDHFYGPTHPSSLAAQAPVDLIEWAWVGAVDTGGATVAARLADGAGGGGGAAVRLVVATDSGFNDPRASAPLTAPAVDPVVQLRIDGLEPATTYRFAVEVDGRLDTARRGSFTTFPEGPASFTFAAASCARVGTNGAVFDAIREADPLLFLQTGDLHYQDIATDDLDKFADAYDTLLAQPGPALLFRRVPVDYVFDDHDFAGNDSDATSTAAPAAQAAYRRYVPSYALPDDTAIYHAFTVGRLRFVVTDTRSYRTPSDRPDDETKTMLGSEQLDWLFAEFEAAANAGWFVVWVQPDPWIAAPTADADHWGGYAVERAHIADRIAALGLADRLLMVSGDAHMLAVDDGSNSDYSASGDAGFVVFQAAALDRPGMVKGGPYSGGTFPGGGQFGLVHVDDHGDHLTIRLEGRRWNGQILVDHVYDVPMPAPTGDDADAS